MYREWRMRDKRSIDKIRRSKKTETILNGVVQSKLTFYSVHPSFIYIGCLIDYAPCVKHYMHFLNAPNIIIYLQCVMVGGYNSNEQYLAHLWDSAMGHQTHPLSIHHPKCWGCSAPTVRHLPEATWCEWVLCCSAWLARQSPRCLLHITSSWWSRLVH